VLGFQRVCLSTREQQVPHRAFSPVRNDILFDFS
jgi:hypothetical protein